MSPAPTQEQTSGPTPVLRQKRGVKVGVGGGGGEGPGAGVEGHASKVVRHACCPDRPALLRSGHRTTKRLATDHKLEPSFLGVHS